MPAAVYLCAISDRKYYLSALLDTLRDAAAENPALNLCIVEEEDI